MSLELQNKFKVEGELYGEYGKVKKVKLHEERQKDEVINKLCKEAQRRKYRSRLCDRGVETRQVEFNIRLPSQWEWSRGQCDGYGPARDKRCNCKCGDMNLLNITRTISGEVVKRPAFVVGWLDQCPNKWVQGHYWA